MSKISKLLGAALIASSLSIADAVADECIAPADPGGGWDFTCRTVGKLLYDLKLVDEPVQVTNMPGGVGAVAYAYVASERADDASVITATSTVGITQIAQGKYPGDTSVMRWLGMLGTDVGVILVPKDSKYATLEDLIAALKEDPSSIAVAGSSGAGGWDHIRILMLAEAAGLVKILAALSDDPVPAFPDAPTASSLGYDVTGYNWRGFYIGGEVTDEEYNEWVATLEKLYNTDEWKQAAESSGLVTVWRGGEAFETYVNEQAEQMRKISQEIGVIQ
ncbi:MAG: C4-dicarboxylate transporter substrate-binding protein [Rhizobiaceae bacterium]|nr:C4-dicarboxylate transporter substrate-binding protein [Rhizobiaceae bacterium]